MIYSSDEGIVTNETDVLLIVVSSHAIQPPTPSLFLVQACSFEIIFEQRCHRLVFVAI